MSNGDLNWVTNFIWGIADDALRDLYVRGKYRDVPKGAIEPECLGIAGRDHPCAEALGLGLAS
jgi:hypothetical protein